MSNTIEIIKVSCAICVNNNRVFLAKRSKGKHLEGFWEFPGGKIENDENPRDALVREIQEELETKIEIIVTFLALLEMIKQSEILCTQKKIFQDIEIKLTIAKA